MRSPFTLVGVLLIAAAVPSWAQGPSLETRVKKAAREHLTALAASQDWRDPVIEIDVPTVSDRRPVCAKPLEVQPLDTRQISRMRFDVVCPADDGWREGFVVRARISAPVVVAAAAVPARQAIQAADLRVELREVSATPDAVARIEDVEEQASRRALRAGQVVQKSFLLPAQLVQRGATVQIVARIGGVQVVNTGESLDNGSRGATVRVRNKTSGTVIDARVIERGMVEPVSRAATSHSLD